MEADLARLLVGNSSGSKFIELNGESATLTFENGADYILDFTKPWSLSIDVVSMPDLPGDDLKLSLFPKWKVPLAIAEGRAAKWDFKFRVL